MCSTCDVSKFEHVNDVYKNQLGASKENLNLFMATKNKKDFYISAENGDNEITFVTYKCPTCGRKFY